MAQKIFQKLGTIRDNNLSDIEDLTLSLNNLLDKLPDDPTSTFISEDLDCIRGINTTALTNIAFLRFAQNTESVLVYNPLTTRFALSDFKPRKTYQNRLDILRVFTGEPRISGGNGLSARYYDGAQIPTVVDGDIDANLKFFTGQPIDTETGFDQNTTWTNGRFDYNGKISQRMSSFAGGVEWEGYFIPTVTGSHKFRIHQSGLFHMDWQADGYGENENGQQIAGGDVYNSVKRIGLENKVQVKVITDNNRNQVDLVDISDKKFIGLNLRATGTNLSSESLIDSCDETTGRITFNQNSVTGNEGDTFELTVKKDLGVEEEVYYDTPILEKYSRYRVKWRFFFPTKDSNNIPITNLKSAAKFIAFDFTSPVDTNRNLRYNRLYTLDYDFTDSAKGKIVDFLDDSILFGGGEIGENNSSGYVKVETNKKIDIKYEPKTKLGDGSNIFTGITRKTIICDPIKDTNLILMGDTSGIEIGSRVFTHTIQFVERGTTTTLPLSEGAEVIGVETNGGVFLSANFGEDATNEVVSFINHRGFVKRVLASTTGAVSAFTSNGAADESRTAGTYPITDAAGNASGTGADFTVVVADDSAPTVTLVSGGSGYVTSETITIAGSAIGGGADIVLTVTGVTFPSVEEDALRISSGYDNSNLKNGMIAIANDGAKDLPDFTKITIPNDDNIVDKVFFNYTNNSMSTGVPNIHLNPPLKSKGSGYSANATNVATEVSPVGGTGLTVDITVSDDKVQTVKINQFGSGYSTGDVIKIKSGDENAKFVIAAVGPFFYFYQPKGLIDKSLTAYCKTSDSLQQTHCLILTQSASVGDTVLNVEPGDGLDAIGTDETWKAQGSAFQGGQSTINSKSSSSFTITINQGLQKPISKGGNITVTNNNDKRILCCPPTDTSPPFEAFELGLQTTVNNPILLLDKGNLVFDNLSATINEQNVSSATETSDANNSIRIQTGVTGEVDEDSNELLENDGTTFKILCA